VSCFPSVEKEIYKLYKKIDFGESDIKCMMCKKSNITGMHRLYCKHFIDEKCLKFLLNFKTIKCPIDNTTMLHGYAEIIEDEKNEENRSIVNTKQEKSKE
jgi:hypothetical protein